MPQDDEIRGGARDDAEITAAPEEAAATAAEAVTAGAAPSSAAEAAPGVPGAEPWRGRRSMMRIMRLPPGPRRIRATSPELEPGMTPPAWITA